MLYGNTFGKYQASTQSVPIGGSMYMTERGPFVTFDDGTEWVRQNTAISYSSKYKKLSNITALGVYGKTASNVSGFTYTSTTLSFITNGTLVASNYAGTIIICDNSITGTGNAVYRSTNGGSSWAAVSVALGTSYKATSVVWAGNRFVLAAWNAISGLYSFFHSTNGSSWTAGTAALGGSTTVGIQLLSDPSTNVVVAVCGNGTSAIQRCTTGSTFANATTLFTTSITKIAGNSSNMICVVSATSYRVSTDNGATWTSAISPSTGFSGATNSSYLGYVGGNFVYDSLGTILGINYTSNPNSTASWLAVPSITTIYGEASGSGTGFYTSDKSKLYIATTKGYMATTDGISWVGGWGNPVGYESTFLPVDSGGGVCIFRGFHSSAATTLDYFYVSSFKSFDYLGNRVTPVDSNIEYIRVY